jgi:murein DD-endopeptidase MepM/ murein hydrolase activator NlpD
VIGFISSIGQHLHYEILVNGRFLDPRSVSCSAAARWKGADPWSLTGVRTDGFIKISSRG